jgi:hypothetical protein
MNDLTFSTHLGSFTSNQCWLEICRQEFRWDRSWNRRQFAEEDIISSLEFKSE